MLLLKNYTSYYYINSFSLLRIFFSIILFVSHIIQTQNTKQNPIFKIKLNQNKQIWKKKKKEKKKEQADLTQLGGKEEDEWRWGGERGSAAWWMPISTGFVLLATSFSTGGGAADEQQSLSLSLSLM